MIITKARKALSFVFLLKSMVGCAVVALTVFGVAVPHLGIESTVAGQGMAASVGAVAGAILAIRG